MALCTHSSTFFTHLYVGLRTCELDFVGDASQRIPFARSHRIAPQPTVYGAGPVNAIIIAENEAGSSLLLHLLRKIPRSFSLFEPFRNYKYNQQQTLQGTFDTLFNCSFARNGSILSEVVWPGVARAHVLRGLDDTDMPDGFDLDAYRAHLLATRQAFNKSESDPILRKCVDSSTRIVKTIRFTGYVRILPKRTIDERLRVIHVLRHPARLVEAQAAAGMLHGGNVSNETWVHGQIKQLCDRVDGGIRSLQSQVPSSHILFLRFEDLVKAPAACVKIVYDFLGANYNLFTPEIERWVSDYTEDSPVATDPPPDGPHGAKTSQHAWPKEVVESCKETLRTGSYL